MKKTKVLNKGERIALAAMLRQCRWSLRKEGVRGIKLTLERKNGETLLQIHGSVDDRFLAKTAMDKHNHPKRG